jgi:hypothetical protein
MLKRPERAYTGKNTALRYQSYENWVIVDSKTKAGLMYYYNTKTHATQWDRPANFPVGGSKPF